MATIELLGSGILFATAIVIGVRFILSVFIKKPGPLPPGPKGLPLVGNVLDLPAKGEREWEHWLKHKDLYGPISSVTVLGVTLVILHSPELAFALLEKKSSIYSARPTLVFADMVGWGEATPLLQLNKKHRLSRKLTHTMIGTPTVITPYLALQETEAHRFLFRLLQQPELFLNHIRTESAAIILKMTYGYTVEPHKPDPLVELADVSMAQFALATTPGTWLVDVFPALKYIPDWVPGINWKKAVKEQQAQLREFSQRPLKYAQQRIAKGNQESTYVGMFHSEREGNLTQEENEIIKWSAVGMYGGGTDTSVNALSSFFLAMSIFPDVQRKAREEIDRVIGAGRLPTFSDRDNLPYIEAVVKESWRWHTVVPMGVGHATDAEDIVNGYRIPKGAVILPNVWWFTHDPAVYPEPHVFNPSRFLGPNSAPDPVNHIFGYGRRICPGRHLAITSVWITIAQTLAAFDISKGLDENGAEIEPIVRFSPSLISRPEDFKATIKPRSPGHEALIRKVEELYPWEESNADELQKIVI
ncbi:cytochrome protein [Xylaria digitata]|nr:cytochrome protein [Xylaria digitata]